MFPVVRSFRRSILLPLALVIAAPAAHGGPLLRYDIEDLGVLPGESLSAAASINDAGDVAGVSGARAFVFRSSGIAALPPLPGHTSSRAAGINDAGVVVGASGKETSLEPMHAVRWIDGVPQDLGTLTGGLFSEAAAVNGLGHVVGNSYVDERWTVHAFVHDERGLVDLTPAAALAFASALNETGQVAGAASATFASGYRAFRWTGGVLEDLGVPIGFAQSFGSAINAGGQVAGHAVTATGNVEQLFRWTGGVAQNLGGVGETNRAWGINRYGDVVGEGRPTSGFQRAFLYTDGAGLLDLNDLIDPASPWLLLAATSINDAGQVAGWGYNTATGAVHAVRLTPSGALTAPAQPSALAATVAGATRVDLRWTDASDNEGGFRIERRMAGGLFAPLTDVAAGTVAFADGGAQPGTTYEYRVAAFNAAGVSAYSNTAAASTPVRDLSAPTVVIESPLGGATVTGFVNVQIAASDDVGVRLVRFLVDGAVKCESVSSTLTCRWNTTKVAPGGHQLRATAVDAAGNIGVHDVAVTVAATTKGR